MVKPKKTRFPVRLRLVLTVADSNLIEEYRRGNGHPTRSAAARDMIRRQGRHFRWKQSRHGSRREEEAVLRNIAREILREYPDASPAALGWNMAKRAGRIVDIGLVKEIAAELTRSR